MSYGIHIDVIRHFNPVFFHQQGQAYITASMSAVDMVDCTKNTIPLGTSFLRTKGLGRLTGDDPPDFRGASGDCERDFLSDDGKATSRESG
jgi:hypothetical protein